MKTSIREMSQSLVEKMKASGRYRPISDDEYKRLQIEQMQKIAMREQDQRKIDLSRLGLHESELSLTWDAIKPNVSEGKKVLEAVKPAYERGWGMVFLWGTWGQAKTLAGKILTATAYRDGKRTAYAPMSSVLDDIRKSFDEPERKQTELLRRMNYWIERDVLFLDELDKTNDTAWAEERLFQLLDQRYARAIREEALTVIASNSDAAELDGYIKSRLKDRRLGPIVYLNGVDGRQVVNGTKV